MSPYDSMQMEFGEYGMKPYLFRYVQLRPEDVAHKLGDRVPCSK